MGHEHILVGEDERPTLTSIEKLLSAAGYRVTGVPDGIAAIRTAQVILRTSCCWT